MKYTQACELGRYCTLCRKKEEGRPHREAWQKNWEDAPKDVDWVCPEGHPWGYTPPKTLLTVDGKTIPSVNVQESSKEVSITAAVGRTAKAARSVLKTEVLRIDRASDEQYKARLAVCEKCPSKHARFRNGKLWTCGKMIQSLIAKKQATCGCVLSKKAHDTKEECPQGHWKEVDEENK